MQNKLNLFTYYLPTLDKTCSCVTIFICCHSGQFSTIKTWSLTPEAQTQNLLLKSGQEKEEETGYRLVWSFTKGFSGVTFVIGTGTWSAQTIPNSELRHPSLMKPFIQTLVLPVLLLNLCVRWNYYSVKVLTAGGKLQMQVGDVFPE